MSDNSGNPKKKKTEEKEKQTGGDVIERKSFGGGTKDKEKHPCHTIKTIKKPAHRSISDVEGGEKFFPAKGGKQKRRGSEKDSHRQ